jgi:hypothetical protein
MSTTTTMPNDGREGHGSLPTFPTLCLLLLCDDEYSNSSSSQIRMVMPATATLAEGAVPS